MHVLALECVNSWLEAHFYLFSPLLAQACPITIVHLCRIIAYSNLSSAGNMRIHLEVIKALHASKVTL